MSRTKRARTRKPSGPAGSKRYEGHRELARRLAERLAKQHAIAAGLRIGVAVSGGADSVALLRLLVELREPLGIVLSVVHFNHQLRGKASDVDEKFVAALAKHHGLLFFVGRENITAKAKQQRANLEDAARRSRYAYFDRLVAEGHVDRVAVAHTADDQAETVLAHMLRGTGIAGLGGIHPESGNVFRPLLKFRRTELRGYLRSLKQPWREDATNRDTTRTRARIRHKLIPLLEERFQPAVVEHLCQLAELAREDEDWMNAAAERRLGAAATNTKDSWRLAIQNLTGGASVGERTASEGGPNEALGKRMIRVLVKRVKPRAGQLSAAHVDAVLRLAQCPDSGKSLHLPGGVEVRREPDSLLFRPMDSETGESAKRFAHAIDLSRGDAELSLAEHSAVLRFQVVDCPPQGRETKDTGTVLDRDKLREPLTLRNWLPGDAMRPLGHQKRHTLSRLLNKLGVSRWQKASWPVVTCGAEIVWCRGLPVAQEFAAGEATRKGVRIGEIPV